MGRLDTENFGSGYKRSPVRFDKGSGEICLLRFHAHTIRTRLVIRKPRTDGIKLYLSPLRMISLCRRHCDMLHAVDMTFGSDVRLEFRPLAL